MSLCKCNCKYLFAVDPGLATGICLIDIQDHENPFMVWSKEVNTTEFYDDIEDMIANPDVHVVFEGFKITDESPDSPWSLELIGIIKIFCYRYGKQWDQQWPVQKAFADNDKLRSVGFWHVGENGHANDALRHAMIWIVEHNRKWTRKLLL